MLFIQTCSAGRYLYMQSLWPNLACYLGNAIKTNGGSIQFV